MQVTLRKCSVCGEWFNTTSQIMNKHYQQFHPLEFAKALAIAFKVVTETCDRTQAEFKRLSEGLAAAIAAKEGYVPGKIVVQGPFKAVSFAPFYRNMMSNIWKNTFGYQRFFILDWWKFKLRIKLNT